MRKSLIGVGLFYCLKNASSNPNVCATIFLFVFYSFSSILWLNYVRCWCYVDCWSSFINIRINIFDSRFKVQEINRNEHKFIRKSFNLFLFLWNNNKLSPVDWTSAESRERKKCVHEMLTDFSFRKQLKCNTIFYYKYLCSSD